jgi:hypothetical protein
MDKDMSLEALISHLTVQVSDVELHNVRIIDVRARDDGYEQLTVEYQGGTAEVPGSLRWSEGFSRKKIGLIGYLVPAFFRHTLEMPVGACSFRDYVDQSLRRIPELDSYTRIANARALSAIGWSCDKRPEGFRAPAGIVPGENGAFVPDETEEVVVRVPPEFIRECRRVQMSAEQVLVSFIGDLAGINNFVSCPRADGYGSNGSDERMLADNWLDRAHGMNAIDLDALDQQDEENEEKQFLRDDFVELLDDYEQAGGDPNEFYSTVKAMVEQRENQGHNE